MSVDAGGRIGPYEVRELLGHGGMGEVYRAYDPRLGRELALKILQRSADDEEMAVDRFVREARAASALNHPNVVTIYEIGESDRGRYIAMELVNGVTLRSLMTEERASAEQLARIGVQVARALAIAHDAGIVHRDIKPENIMLRSDGLVKVLDFGIARLLGNAQGDPTRSRALQTQAGLAIGTLRYMSPEQACAEPVSAASDVFSLGVILHELATGQHPFATTDGPASDFAIMSRILTAEAAPVTSTNAALPSELDTLILRMLAKEAARRPAAREVESALAELGAVVRGDAPVIRVVPTDQRTVGRDRERQALADALASADAGQGRMITVSGEPGIGKSTLVEQFLADVAAASRVRRVARGRCSERLAGTEAYLPVLEALDALTRGPGAAQAVEMMKRFAPTWYLQIAPPSPSDSAEQRALSSVQASSQERMKRELASLLGELSSVSPVVLFLDDFHWADASSVDVLSYLGARLDAMRLLVVVTVRPAELRLTRHPFAQLKLDLQARGVCRELSLDFLTPTDVEKYLELEFPRHEFPGGFAQLVHAKTEGSPLFMADVLRYLRTRGIVGNVDGRWVLAQSVPAIETDLPESIRGMIQRKIEQIADGDRKVLVAASVQGYEFDSVVVADVTGIDAASIEEVLETLEHVYGFVRRSQERDMPDGTLTVRYRFVHVLYQNALYASLTPSRRIAMSARAAESLVRHHAERAGEIAADLALLFEAARENGRAVDQMIIAAQNAARVFANQEVVALTERALGLLAQLPHTPERDEQEMALQVLRVNALGAIAGLATAEVGVAAARSYELWVQLGSRPEHFATLGSLWTHYAVAGDLEMALRVGEQLMDIATKTGNRVALPLASYCLGIALHHLGRHPEALAVFDTGLAAHGPDLTPYYVSILIEPGVGAASERARVLWVMGYPERALASLRDALALAEIVPHPEARGFAQLFGAFIHQFLGDAETTFRYAEAVLAIARERDIATSFAWGTVLHGWSVAMRGDAAAGIGEIRASLDAQAAAGALVARPQFLALLAEACVRAGRLDEALAEVKEGLDCAARTGDHYWDSELERLRGEVLDRMQAGASEVDACFERAMADARARAARSLELRAACSAARTWSARGERARAREVLQPCYDWFTEGFDTPDLVAARALLDSLH